MTYRYYRRSTTTAVLKTVRRLIERDRLKPGEILSIRGTFTLKRWYRLTIRTESEQFQFTGFAWFYGGEGTRGLQQVLSWLLVPEEVRKLFTLHEFHGDNNQPNSFMIQ